MNTRSILFVILLSGLVGLGGCRLFTGWNDRHNSPTDIELTNESSHDLVVSAMTEDMLSRVLLAEEMQRDQIGAEILHPGDSQTIPFEEIGGNFRPRDTVVFVIYAAPTDGNVFRIARTLHVSYLELTRQMFEVGITDDQLTYDHQFGDPYWIQVDERDQIPDVDAPRIEDGKLVLWVSFSGCDEGTFTLSHQMRDRGAVLSIFHDYPDVDFDCERLNHKKLVFDLAGEVLAQPQIILLNPNRGADPYGDAFVLKP